MRDVPKPVREIAVPKFAVQKILQGCWWWIFGDALYVTVKAAGDNESKEPAVRPPHVARPPDSPASSLNP
jgi:hypothetical protein